MSMGDRIKGLRMAHGLSIRDLAQAVGVSAQAISKYERNLDLPGSDKLILMAKLFNRRVEYFFRGNMPQIQAINYRKCNSFSKKQERFLMAEIQDWLERYLELEGILGRNDIPELSASNIKDYEAIELVAEKLRDQWQLGTGPISNLIDILEVQGFKVKLTSTSDKFDACSFVEGSGHYVIAVQRVSGDRQRFSIAHELGHLFLKVPNTLDEEQAANRFAGCFLLPKSSLLRDLGTKRRSLNLGELTNLKIKHKVSIQAIVYRAKDLGIVSESYAQNFFRIFRSQGLHRLEPGPIIHPELPRRYQQLAYCALEEGFIAPSRFDELMGTGSNE